MKRGTPLVVEDLVTAHRRLVAQGMHPLRAARTLRSLSRQQLAEATGLSTTSIKRAELGQSLGAYSRRQLCAFFEMDAVTLGLIERQTRAQEQIKIGPSTLRDPDFVRGMQWGLECALRICVTPDSTQPTLLPHLLNEVAVTDAFRAGCAIGWVAGRLNKDLKEGDESFSWVEALSTEYVTELQECIPVAS